MGGLSSSVPLIGGEGGGVRGQKGGDKKSVGETLACRNQISVNFAFVCSRLTFHKNVCFTVCLNSCLVL